MQVHQVVKPLGPGLQPSDVSTHKLLQEAAIQAALDLANGRLKSYIPKSKGYRELFFCPFL